ncbi:MAG: hypothetical protein ACRYFS_13030 [Janthinobacterium lividum]
MRFTAEAYREASLEHVDSARELFDQKRFALANYIAGVAVECIFRAYSLRLNRNFDCRHDLKAWYDAAKYDNIVPNDRREIISLSEGIIYTHWSNSHRYCSVKFLSAYFKLAGLDRGVRGNFVKELTRQTVEAAFEIVTLGDRQWNSSSKK